MFSSLFSVKNRIWWIVSFALLLRLYALDHPLLGVHEWRQSDTAIMARNFFENGYRLFYPQMNWGGGGYVECEFPIYPFIVALFYGVFGYSEAWGRLVTALIYVVGLYYLYRLMDEISNRRAALWTAFFFAVLPMNIFYGRVFMPDAMMITGSIVGVYYYLRWIKTDALRYWLLSLIGITLAVLIKVTALYMGLPLAYLSWLRFGRSMWINKKIWLYIALLSAGMAGWYYHAHQLGLQTGISFGMWSSPGDDKWGNWDLVFSAKYWNRIIFKWWLEDWFVTIGFVLGILGLGVKRETQEAYLIDAWLIAVLVYYFIVGMGNYVHDYYTFPFSVPIAMYMGKFCGKMIDFKRQPRWIASFVCLLAIITTYVSLNSHYQKLKNENPAHSSVYQLAVAIRDRTPQDAKILCYSPWFRPTVLNLSYRKGWLMTEPEINDAAYLKKRRQEGAQYLVFLQEDLQEMKQKSPALYQQILAQYPVVEEKTSYLILDFANKRP